MTDMNKVLRDESRLDRKSHRRILINLLLQKVKPVVTDATKKAVDAPARTRRV